MFSGSKIAAKYSTTTHFSLLDFYLGADYTMTWKKIPAYSVLIGREMTNRQFNRDFYQSTNLKSRLVFFDMDHTILNASQYHRKSLTQSLHTLFGLNELPFATTSGYPYLEVVRKYAQAAGIDDAFFDANQTELENLLITNMLALLPGDLSACVYPGAIDLLSELSEANIALGLTTGTWREIAVPILKKAGLLSYFPLLAFGDQVKEREQILQKALAQAAWVYGLSADDIQLVTVGDATTDITAGKAFGAVTVAVANGVTSIEQLAACQPDYLFENLKDTAALYDAITAG